MPRQKLADLLVREMRERYAAGGISQAALAREYGLGAGHAHRILIGDCRADAGGPIHTPAPATRLTPEQVDDIVTRYMAGAELEDLAHEYGISRHYVYDLARGRHGRGAGLGPLKDHPRGEGPKQGKRRLTPAQVVEARETYDQGWTTLTALGDRYGISAPAMGAIIRGDSYRDVGGPTHRRRPPRQWKSTDDVDLTCWGETHTLHEWSRHDRCVVAYGTLQKRVLRLGWDLERALTTPSRGDRYK